MTTLNLTDDEALLLDGKVSSNAQATIDAIKRARELASAEGCDTKIADFIAKAIEAAKTSGRLVFRHAEVRCCGLCGKSGGYRQYSRSSRWHRKGQTDFSKPIYLYGVDLIDSFVRIKGSPELGCCDACWKTVKPLLARNLEGVHAEIPESITGHPPKFKWHQNRKCSKCGWAGHEGQMGRNVTLMGDGTYPSTCPQCKAKNVFLSTTIELVDGFTLVEAVA